MAMVSLETYNEFDLRLRKHLSLAEEAAGSVAPTNSLPHYQE